MFPTQESVGPAVSNPTQTFGLELGRLRRQQHKQVSLSGRRRLIVERGAVVDRIVDRRLSIFIGKRTENKKITKKPRRPTPRLGTGTADDPVRETE